MTTAPTAGFDDVSELYRELILDHSRHPRHFGKLDAATHSAEGINPLCGDKLELYLRVDADERIEDASFQGSGCAISVASASLLTDRVIGASAAQAVGYCSEVIDRLTHPAQAGAISESLDKLRALDGVRQFPSRVKCATLAWRALESALRGSNGRVTTE